MRIGINLLAVLPGVSGGIEFYIRNLLRELLAVDRDNTYYLFTNRDNHASFASAAPNAERMLLPVAARPQWKRIAYEQVRLPFLARSLRLDVLHSPTYTWPVFAPVPGVVTICDMLYLHYPESIDKIKLAFWRVFVPWSARRCKRVLTISNHAREDIITALRVPSDKVLTTPLAVDRSLLEAQSGGDDDAVLSRYGIQKPYLLYVGGVGPHKNALVLVRALGALRAEPATADLNLVITGNDYGSRQKIAALADRLDLGQAVRLPGYVAREELPSVYRAASAYVAPSKFEGFGLTALEAMAYGVPVVVSNRASLPEVVGDAALVVDAEDALGIAQSVARILGQPELRGQLIAKGHDRVRAYSWQETARQTLSAYREAVEGKVNA